MANTGEMKFSGIRSAVREYKEYNGFNGMTVDIMYNEFDDTMWADIHVGEGYSVYPSPLIHNVTRAIHGCGYGKVNEKSVKLFAAALCGR